MGKKVSIIMGIYNCAKTLPDAIDSILMQTYDNWELIMCDDCSTDETYQIAKNYENRYPDKIILLSNDKNMRLAASLNHCLKYANGEYIARMDADDKSRHDRLEKQVKFLDNHQEYMVVGSQLMAFDENGEIGIKDVIEFPNKFTPAKYTPFTHATIMMRKIAYDKLDGYRVIKETRRCEDADLWFRFYSLGFDGANIKEPLYYVRDDINAFKRRKFIYGIDLLKVCINGYKLLDYPIYYYIYLIKPLLSSLMPAYIMKKYHKIKEIKK